MSMRCDSQASLLAFMLVSACIGHKPKARVATRRLIKLVVKKILNFKKKLNYHLNIGPMKKGEHNFILTS
jgi:hypothetical protein